MKPQLLFVDDDDTFRAVLTRELEGFGYEVCPCADASAALERLRKERLDVALVDLRLPGADGLELLASMRELAPRLPVILLTGHGSFPEAVRAMRQGAFDFLAKPAPLDELELALQRATEHGGLRRQNQRLRQLMARDVAPRILGESAAIGELRSAIRLMGQSCANVLVRGESGTGKELVARALHEASPRRDGAFVVVNCAAIPTELFESELFGHKRGAFTGAHLERPGLVELAEAGTLFLDEIGDLPGSLQPALLRLIQFGEYRPVGSDRTEKADVRFISATNRKLEESVRAGEFREDLIHRIATLGLEVPPLRERGGDVRLLSQAMLARQNEGLPRAQHKRFSEGALDRLQAEPWPGNVRELENVIVRLVTLVETDEIGAGDVERQVAPFRGSAGLPPLETLNLDRLERAAVTQALRKHQGNRARVARELGVATKTLYNKIKQHGISPGEWDSAPRGGKRAP